MRHEGNRIVFVDGPDHIGMSALRTPNGVGGIYIKQFDVRGWIISVSKTVRPLETAFVYETLDQAKVAYLMLLSLQETPP